MIQVSIDVPPEFQNHPDANWNVQDLSDFLNSDKFDRRERASICLHESTHLVYGRDCLRQCGCEWFELELYGPAVEYDPFTEKFRQQQAGVEGLPFRVEMSADPLMVAKHFIGPVHTGQKLLGNVTEKELWKMARRDLKDLNAWHCQRSQLVGDVSWLTLDIIRDSVYRDCRSPAFRKKLWDAAKEFEARVFGKQN